jgi:carboxynorspermidine decarboxylase
MKPGLCFEEIGSMPHTHILLFIKRVISMQFSKYSSYITFNSLAQYQKIFCLNYSRYQRKISAGLRINPEFSEISHGFTTLAPPDQDLGIIAEDLKNGLA